PRDVLVGADALADDEDGAGTVVVSPAGAGGYLSAHGTVEAGPSAGVAGQRAQQRGGERKRNHRVYRSGLVAILRARSRALLPPRAAPAPPPPPPSPLPPCLRSTSITHVTGITKTCEMQISKAKYF
ncbi:jg19110, partial [Pararge aegeria aegeria]